MFAGDRIAKVASYPVRDPETCASGWGACCFPNHDLRYVEFVEDSVRNPMCQRTMGCMHFAGHKGKCLVLDGLNSQFDAEVFFIGEGFDPKSLFSRLDNELLPEPPPAPEKRQEEDSLAESRRAKLSVGNRYRLGKHIGKGTFGVVYLAEDLQTRARYAAKGESAAVKRPQIPTEARFLCVLADLPGFPSLHWCGVQDETNVIIMDLLGLSLSDLVQSCQNKFSVKTTCMLADQMLTRVQELHERLVVHRDVKPENFLMGLGASACTVHMIDFGLAKFFRQKETGMHLRFSTGKRLCGTPRFASINAHTSEQSRRDDLESLGYGLVFFLRGKLPWQDLGASVNERQFGIILEAKKNTPLDALCQGCPPQLLTYMEIVRRLGFEEKPDYSRLRQLFRSVMEDIGAKHDGRFDWMLSLPPQNPWVDDRADGADAAFSSDSDRAEC